MVIKKIKLVKKNGRDIFNCHPVSSSDVIIHEGSLTVKDVLDAVVESVEKIESKLSRPGIYMTNDNGEVITDESGIGLVEIL